MKRLHVHVGVADLDRSIGFYSTLFGAEPTVAKSDYAKWMLDDPRVNFAISASNAHKGVEHLGIQVEDRDELAEVYDRLRSADRPVAEEGCTTCCYAKSEKSWVTDPDGVLWEAFHTTGGATVYGDGVDLSAVTGTGPSTGPNTGPSTGPNIAAGAAG
ncbi:ArsI/CadI family heavy metal resistance metalloenzyme [Qipengyuania sp. DY56-A-20]|jgi:catechol 2,3-dioxygenase-like lactoylglutathione lyase family enzyme|uniref:ArsI/CadI family heavy metal resistance metalloenzyme n=1 Tax=Qipengyuania benthica TaxID=3067651 RepID=A0ABT9H4B5_9SPHN|nr:ArsI/CadI family heavy metal resistance metalloenzyme [Qipengyuania sp. DY56-A-20]MDP4538145.1 ArsI/CadI family heavy metal resistance metalloenzyme [Qipengyuania sp. DY56-A-20]